MTHLAIFLTVQIVPYLQLVTKDGVSIVWWSDDDAPGMWWSDDDAPGMWWSDDDAPGTPESGTTEHYGRSVTSAPVSGHDDADRFYDDVTTLQGSIP